jgi:hypothetical protein
MLKDANPYFIKWSMNKVINWNNKEHPTHVIHIHGTKDLIFPFRLIDNPVPVKNGSHIMITTFSEEINKILKKELN